MAAVIIIYVIIVFLIAVLSARANKKKHKSTARRQTADQTRTDYYKKKKKRSAKDATSTEPFPGFDSRYRPASYSAARTSTAPKSSTSLENDILTRAKLNTLDSHEMDMHDNPDEREAYLRKELEMERTDVESKSGANAIMEAAKERALEAQLDNAADSRYDLMQQVSDLMIMGPQYEMEFQRDFLAEGMDMLNRCQLGEVQQQ